MHHPPHILSYVKDLPNICSLAGLLCAAASLYCSSLSLYAAAVIWMLWAVLFDWADGIVARKLKGRQPHQGSFGAQLDSMIDMISFGACPALFLMSYGRFDPVFFPGAFIILASSALRLSYFNLYGLVDAHTYKGLALDNNIIILGAVFLLEGRLGQRLFSYLLYGLFMGLCAFNLMPVRTPKFSSRWFIPLSVYTIGLTCVYILVL